MKILRPAIPALLLIGVVYAQQPPMMGSPMGGPPPGRGPGGGGMGDNFFPIELVMRNQQAIGLTTEQQETIRTAMQKNSPRFSELQWQLSAEEESLNALIKEQKTDAEKVLTQLNKVLVIENEMKRLQLGLMLSVKNALTPEQQAKLAEIKKRNRSSRMPPPPQEPGPPPGGE